MAAKRPAKKKAAAKKAPAKKKAAAKKAPAKKKAAAKKAPAKKKAAAKKAPAKKKAAAKKAPAKKKAAAKKAPAKKKAAAKKAPAKKKAPAREEALTPRAGSDPTINENGRRLPSCRPFRVSATERSISFEHLGGRHVVRGTELGEAAPNSVAEALEFAVVDGLHGRLELAVVRLQRVEFHVDDVAHVLAWSGSSASHSSRASGR